MIKVGDLVIDNLAKEIKTVIRISKDSNGDVEIWLDSDFLEGKRYSWEVTLWEAWEAIELIERKLENEEK